MKNISFIENKPKKKYSIFFFKKRRKQNHRNYFFTIGNMMVVFYGTISLVPNGEKVIRKSEKCNGFFYSVQELTGFRNNNEKKKRNTKLNAISLM